MRCQGITKLATLLGQDIFPALKHLNVSFNEEITDAGVTSLCNGLLSAPRTRLLSLDLDYTQMGHLGMAALGAVIQAGRLTLLETLNLSRNHAMTDAAVFVSVGAIQQAKNAVPHLRTLKMHQLPAVTGVGVGVLLTALIHNCPQLELIDMSSPARRVVKESMHALVSTLGWKGKLKL